MRLNLREIIEIPGGSVPFECDVEADNLDFPAIREYKSAPHAVGRVYNEAGILTIEGTVTADMTCICDRCGTDYDRVKVTEIDATIAEEDTADNPELFLLDGDEIDLDEILSTCFILDMDMKFLCKDDCKGLCPECGKNLNLGACSCRKQLDPRFAVLEQLLDK